MKVGSSSVKFVELLHKKNEYRLRKLGFESFPFSEKKEGYLNYVGFVAQKIKDIIRRYNLNSQKIVTGVEGESVAIRVVRIPQMKESELSEAIKWQAQEHLPYPLEDITVDYHVLKKDLVGAGGKEMSVLLVGVKKSTIDEYLRIFQEVGICPAIVDVNSLALYNVFERIENKKKEGTALINIGHRITNLLILAEDYPFLVRDIKFGGDNITRALIESFGVNYQEAEKIKKAEDLSYIGHKIGRELEPEQVEEVIRGALSELINEIVRSFEYYTSNREGAPVQKIILSGGVSLIKGIDVFLSQELEVPVEKFNPFVKISYAKGKFGEFLPYFSPVFSVPVGLALREVRHI
ncbi:MAG TPA: type IV pilus assembly protein PilM [Candidatus Aerophobetes bacterium]|uniref:Type IV pilus assembly protein PilM n=1 Tax=Aerophobetes bacterium TaxID=2030807 RepID=A0A7V5HYK1_UNCAE|nr:type IV pilus assembly protein PilM [Candidatus Aerophobetes bacterium]